MRPRTRPAGVAAPGYNRPCNAGSGPELASRIMAARPFATADDLRRVKGIGPKKYEKIRPFFR